VIKGHKVDALRPCEGIVIVSTALNVPGPVAVARLTAMGATAIKIEPPAGDPLAGHSRPWYDELHRGIETKILDLKTADGRDRFDACAAHASVLITAQRPAALARLGLDWERLHARFPHLSHVAILGFAPPRANDAGHDLTYQAAEGLIGPPNMPQTLMVDLAAAERVVCTALAVNMAFNGVGQYAAVNLADVAHAMAAPIRHGLTTSGGLLGGGFAGYRLYRAREGWVALAALEPRFLERLRLQAAGVAPDELRFAELFATRTAREWEAWAREQDVPLVAVHAGESV
jgi:alpha-methylacyl-CoA racemase